MVTYQLIATDLDGTLLDDNKQISIENQKAIRYAIEKGIKIIPCTGRAVQGVTRFPFLTSLKTLAVTHNGGMIINLADNQIIYNCTLQNTDTEFILNKGFSWNTNMCVWIDNRLYCNKINEYTLKYSEINNVAPLEFYSYKNLPDREVTKILWYDTENNISAYARTMEQSVSTNVTCCTSTPHFLEFFSSKTSKAIALAYIGNLYGIKKENIIAFGDEKNDMTMLEFAGMGIAMANARDEVKAKADFVTLSNNDNGFADGVYRFV